MTVFELTDLPEGVVNYLTKANTEGFQSHRTPNDYWVTDICSCLRQSYYKISGTAEDASPIPTVESLWSLRSRRYLHNLTYSYKWREFDIEKEMHLDDLDEKLVIHGRLDMYDYKARTIIDLKTSNAIKWQLRKSMIPRHSDIDQIQCYNSLFSDKIAVSCLTLLYADMKNMIAFKIPLIDKMKWIADRMSQLHISLNITKLPPAAETSTACDFCRYKQRCQLESVT